MKPGYPSPRGPAGFSRAELAATLAVLAVVALVTLPGLAGGRPRSSRIECANHLRQIGMAFQLWGNDHEEREPWEIMPAGGGTYRHALAANVWFHFAWMSNELATPKILWCPSDTGQAARDFSGDPTGGYLHPNFANRATSYFLSHPRGGRPQDMLAGDRNLTADLSTSCSRFIATFAVNRPFLPAGMRWTTNLHNNAGNILALDGRVEQFTTPQLQRSQISLEDISALHFITPR